MCHTYTIAKESIKPFHRSVINRCHFAHKLVWASHIGSGSFVLAGQTSWPGKERDIQVDGSSCMFFSGSSSASGRECQFRTQHPQGYYCCTCGITSTTVLCRADVCLIGATSLTWITGANTDCWGVTCTCRKKALRTAWCHLIGWKSLIAHLNP